jgi:murein DD-endopeptidase MepM/ murein hydrolase activator NlpD
VIGLLLALLAPLGFAFGAAPRVVYRPPVDGPIVDHFRPPACTWCPGNRGIDYAPPRGTPVHASAAGVVSFAGPVGSELFVVVTHSDGLRSTYAFLASVAVRVGQRVAAGEVVGTSGSELHFGVRRGTVYLDPELLFAGWVPRARLVPTDGGPPRPPGRRLGAAARPLTWPVGLPSG